MNHVTLLGNLGSDPETKVVGGGQIVMRLKVATSRVWLDDRGNKTERTDWHTVEMWGKRAEALSKMLCKGSKVMIEGRIETDTYEKNGEKRYATKIVCLNLEFAGGKRPERAPAPADDDTEGAPKDDVPF